MDEEGRDPVRFNGGDETNMKTLIRMVVAALLLASLSGCGYGTYNRYGDTKGRGPGEPPNYLYNCPMNDAKDCYTWFYGN